MKKNNIINKKCCIKILPFIVHVLFVNIASLKPATETIVNQVNLMLTAHTQTNQQISRLNIKHS